MTMDQMNDIERIVACEKCGYSGSTVGSARWLKVGDLCIRCDGKYVAWTPATQGAVDITDEMCAAALKAERSQRWNSDELRVWAMLAAARDAAGGQLGMSDERQAECAKVGHDWNTVGQMRGEPTGIVCSLCGDERAVVPTSHRGAVILLRDLRRWADVDDDALADGSRAEKDAVLARVDRYLGEQ